MSKISGTESYLGAFNEALHAYEQVVVRHAQAVAEMRACERELEEVRKRLLHMAGGRPVAGLLPAAPSKKKPARRKKVTNNKNVLEIPDTADPRVRRSLTSVSKALRQLGGSAHKRDIAKKVGRSAGAVIQHLSRGVKMGIFESKGGGEYALTQA